MLQNLSEKVRRRTPANPTTLPWPRAIGLAIAVGIAYFLAEQLSFALLARSDGLAMFWLAGGVSSGVLIALGRSARLPVATAMMVAIIVANLTGRPNIWAATAFTLCNVGEALFAAWLIERYFGSPFSLDSLRNVLGLVAAAVVANAASAVGATAAHRLFLSPTAPIWTTWQHWFASGVVGILTAAPLVIGLAEALRAPPPRREIIEGVAALVALAAVMTVIIVLLPEKPWEMVAPVSLLFPILWLAARCQPVFAAAAAFIVSLTIVWTTTFGIVHFGDPALPIGDRITGAQAAILGLALCAYVLAALFAERRQAEARHGLLIAELDHRVKNVLARVAAVVMHTRRRCGTMDEFVEALDGRIQSMASAHALLSQSRWSGVSLTNLIRHQLAPYTTDANTMINGRDVTLTSAQTQAVAMVIHELVTNAAKHGALSSPNGRVSVRWDRIGAKAASILTVTWCELGGPPVATSIQSGYGSNLIRDLIPHELGGTVDLIFASDGLSCKMEIPLRMSVAFGDHSSAFPTGQVKRQVRPEGA
jgi:two-component sensor histidine kinase/integral membrane sensor domain MASE1